MPDMTIGTPAARENIPTGFYDPSKIAAALQQQQPGKDGRNILTGNALLSTMNPIPAPKWVPPQPAGATMERDSGGDYVPAPAKPGYFISSNGTILNSSDGGKTFSDKYDNPTGNGNRDQAVVTYQVTDDGKSAVPVAASNKYQPGAWVDYGRDLAKWAAVMATAGTAGAYLGAGTAAEGTGAVSGMDLAGDAALGTGNNIATAGAGLGETSAGGLTTGATEFGSNAGLTPQANFGSAGYDFGGGTGATFGGGNAGAGFDALGYGSGSIGTGLANTGTGLQDAFSGLQQAYQSTAPAPGASSTPSTPASTTPTQSTTPSASNATDLGKLLSGGVGTALAGAGAAAVAGANSGDLNTPNYTGAAQAQSASARMDQSNPWGSLTYSQNGVDSQGNPVYKQNVALNSADQANLDSARQGQSSALFGLNNSISGYADAVKKLPGLYGDAGSQQGLTQQAIDSMYHQQTALLDPQYKQQQDALTSQLANQGVVQGSQAYNTAMDNYARQRDYAYGNARDSSINQGNTLANQLFSQNLQAHTTGMNDLSTQQNQYLTDANGLSNTVKQPTFASTPAPTNYLGAAALQGQGNLNQYNAKTGAANSTTNGLFSLGGAILSNPTWQSYLGNLFSTGG